MEYYIDTVTTGTTTAPFGIFEMNLDGSYAPTTVASYKYEVANEIFGCAGFYMKDTSEFYAYVSFKTTKIQKIAKILSASKSI